MPFTFFSLSLLAVSSTARYTQRAGGSRISLRAEQIWSCCITISVCSGSWRLLSCPIVANQSRSTRLSLSLRHFPPNIFFLYRAPLFRRVSFLFPFPSSLPSCRTRVRARCCDRLLPPNPGRPRVLGQLCHWVPTMSPPGHRRRMYYRFLSTASKKKKKTKGPADKEPGTPCLGPCRRHHPLSLSLSLRLVCCVSCLPKSKPCK